MSEKQPELLPCPWCPPDEAGHSKPEARFIADMHGHAVICTHCAARGPLFGTEAEAIAAWNTRPQSGALREALEAIASCTFPQRGSGGGAHRQMSAVDMAKLAGDAIARSHDEMSARQSQAVGVGFRMLEHNEIIREGDEFLQDDAVTWVKAGDESGTRWMVGCKHSTVFFKPIRRRITPNDSGKEGGE